MFGPFGKFIDAAEAVGLLGFNEATAGVWVAAKYRIEAEKAVKLFDGISKEQAAALFSSDESG
jgi:hypothetical protein